MKVIRIFLLVLIIIGVGLLLTQNVWVPRLVDRIMRFSDAGSQMSSISTLSGKGVIKGNVVLGPVCPVEHIPPDLHCAPKPYVTTIHAQPTNPSGLYMTMPTDALGTFSMTLNSGTYLIHAESQKNSYYPRCNDLLAQVTAGASQTIIINCDTGIR